jgi:hypothetical protein
MRAYVLPDARLARQAGRFVWLSIDTENARNAEFLARYPVDTWPTFLVLAPSDGKPVLKWLGSASAAQLDEMLERARSSLAPRRRERRAEEFLARADRANAEGRPKEGIEAYREALKVGGAGWSRRARTVASLVLAYAAASELESCATTARKEAPGLGRGASFATVVGTGLSCVNAAPAEASWRSRSLAALEPLARSAVGIPGLLADDRAGLYEGLVEARTARGDERGVRTTAESWWRFLERERGRAADAEARASLDSWRVAAAMALGDPARALPALEASQRDLPRDYNPPARRAYLLRELGRFAEARAAVEQALAKAYGPRKLKVYQLAASILEKQGDRAALAATLEEALAYASMLPAQQRDEKVASALRAKSAAIQGE